MNAQAGNDASSQLVEAVREATAGSRSLSLCAGGTKAFLGHPPKGDADELDLTAHRGVLQYEPGELVLRARGGTALSEIESLLAEQGQTLPFEPPQFAPGATLGGAVAAGLAGPARPYRGAVRDALLGVRIINGLGETLSFGGQVMKNVAGYDVTRLMAGSMGTLAILLDVSIKVCPRGETETTLVQECTGDEAIGRMRALASASQPLSATCFDGERLYIRLTGTEQGVRAAAAVLGGERQDAHSAWWQALRDHRLPSFAAAGDLWRISLPAPRPCAEGDRMVEWGGALRWRCVEAGRDLRAEGVFEPTDSVMLFRAGRRAAPDDPRARYHPLQPALERLHRRIKHSFDPHGVFNRGRMYGEW